MDETSYVVTMLRNGTPTGIYTRLIVGADIRQVVDQIPMSEQSAVLKIERVADVG